MQAPGAQKSQKLYERRDRWRTIRFSRQMFGCYRRSAIVTPLPEPLAPGEDHRSSSPMMKPLIATGR